MDNPIAFSKSRQSARNQLRAYLAGFGQTLPEELGELEALAPAEAAARGAKMLDRIEHEPSVPATVVRYAKGNPAPWMRPPNAKPQMRHARKG